MKKGIFLLVFVFTSYSCFSQLDHVELLIGKTEPQVIQYLDSLNNLKSNLYYKIKRDITKNANLLLGSEFSIYDEKYYTCIAIYASFQRINGVEVCIKQTIAGGSEYAEPNLSYIKDNFKYVSNNEWERPYGEDIPLKIQAVFERINNDNYGGYVITFSVISNK